MVSNIIGNYLLEKGLISFGQLEKALLGQSKAHVKLGLIAVAEGLMMHEEAERVNQLQVLMDKHFGEIAVEKGYLTQGQVEALLKKQRNAYLAFAQALQDEQIMTVERLEGYLVDFQMEHQLTLSDMEDLKSDDVDRILPLYMPVGCDRYLNVASTALRTLMRCVDTEIYPGKAYIAKECKADNGALQCTDGEQELTCGMTGMGNGLLPLACTFGREDFEKMDEDALDAVGEMINCIIGLYSSSLSQNGVSIELYPPEYSTQISGLFCNEMLVLPLHVKGQKINFVIALDDKIEMVRQE